MGDNPSGDSANQLTRENDPITGITTVWEYDDAGNIKSRTEYAYTTGVLGTPTDTVTYTYSDTEWGDLLTGYGSVAFSYDGVGNLTNDGTWIYTWQHGRQLASMSDGIDDWEFTYDANGMRTKRTNGTATYEYTYNGSQLAFMKKGYETLSFIYGANGPAIVFYNQLPYFYVTNLQGDVIGITSHMGNLVVSYTYDAWGNVTSVTGSMAATLGQLNPLRYRGYVYDQETGLYYLQSRYYNPTWGRFINADAFVSTGQGLLGNNMFAYCNNNPVMYQDPAGNLPMNAMMLYDGGGSAKVSIGEKLWNRLVNEVTEYVQNEDEAVVLKAKFLAFYKGVPVLKANFGDNGGGLSYGIIILDDGYTNDEKGIRTLKHEYGHRVHMDQIGFINYTFTTAIPSLVGAGLNSIGLLNTHYYSQPWEYVADMLGGVDRTGYTEWARSAGLRFWAYTLMASALTGGI